MVKAQKYVKKLEFNERFSKKLVEDYKITPKYFVFCLFDILVGI